MRGDTNFKGFDSSHPSVYFLFCDLNVHHPMHGWEAIEAIDPYVLHLQIKTVNQRYTQKTPSCLFRRIIYTRIFRKQQQSPREYTERHRICLRFAPLNTVGNIR